MKFMRLSFLILSLVLASQLCHAADKRETEKELITPSMIQLIDLLSNSQVSVRDSAQSLIIHKLKDSNSATYFIDITHWNKFIKNALLKKPSADLKLRTLDIYEVTDSPPNIFINQCFKSANNRVISKALRVAHLCDNSADRQILSIQVTPEILHAYLFALGHIANPQSHSLAMKLLKQHKKTPLTKASYLSSLPPEKLLMRKQVLESPSP